MIYTLDTNALTALLTGRGGVAEKFAHALSEGNKVTLKAVSYFEMKRGLFLPRFTRRLMEFEAFVRDYELLPMDVVALDLSTSRSSFEVWFQNLTRLRRSRERVPPAGMARVERSGNLKMEVGDT
ncbi:hypothetical protein BH24DEI2_BH24DEI2_16710 [soil metagenome]